MMARLYSSKPLLIVVLCAVASCRTACSSQAGGGKDTGPGDAIPDVSNQEASTDLDGGTDAGDASVFCPHIVMRQSEPEPLGHGPGKDCGPNCRQVTFADSMHYYDIWGDYIVYTTHEYMGGSKDAYLANVVTGEEWRVENGPWQQPGCTWATIDNGIMAYIYSRLPSNGPVLVQLFRLFDVASMQYTDLACLEFPHDDIVPAKNLDITTNTLAYSMSMQCSNCQDLYTMDIFQAVGQRSTNFGHGVIETRAGQGLVVWTDLNQNNTEIKMYEISTGDGTNISNHSADQFRARIGANKVVWVDHRNDAGGYYSQRNSDIYYYDLASGQTVEVCTHPAQQDQPDIAEDIVVWGDWRNNPNPVPVFPNEFINADIFMKRLSTGVETQLTDFEGIEYYPRVVGNRVFFQMVDDNGIGSIFMIEIQD